MSISHYMASGLSGNEINSYCRDIETYLCQKNDGHLVRVVGPSFEVVSRWAAGGVPLKVAYQGIDRYFERYYRKGPRRRPVRIDFCEADVLDVFDEWRRALGLIPGRVAETAPLAEEEPGTAAEIRRGPSLPAHLERALLRLTNARVQGTLGEAGEALIDSVSQELDRVRASARGLRGDARRGVIDRLAALDRDMLRMARATLDDRTRADLSRRADEELAGFRNQMDADRFSRTREAAIDGLVREQLGLPTLVFA
jgi:hypothetical protein